MIAGVVHEGRPLFSARPVLRGAFLQQKRFFKGFSKRHGFCGPDCTVLSETCSSSSSSPLAQASAPGVHLGVYAMAADHLFSCSKRHLSVSANTMYVDKPQQV